MKRSLVLALVVGCAPPASPPAAPPLAAAAPLAPSVATSAPPPAPMPAVWRVGAVLPFTGAEASFGEHAKRGVELAVAEANERTPARRIEVVFRDSGGGAPDATTAARELVEGEHVLALLGDVTLARAKAVGAIAAERRVPSIALAATAPELAKLGPFVFRTALDDEAQGRAGARYVVETLGKRKVGTLHPLESAQARAVVGAFREEAKRLGADVVAAKDFVSIETDYHASLDALRRAGAEVVYAPSFANQMLAIAKQAAEVGFKPDALFGSDAWDDPARLKEAGAALEGAHFTAQFALDAPYPATDTLVERHRAKHGGSPTTLTALGYDAARVCADAIARATAGTPEAVRDALSKTERVEGATGPITIGPGGGARKPALVVELRSGVPRFVAAIPPP